MNDEIDDIIIELENLATKSNEDFNNKFWGNYEKYLNNYNTLLRKIHNIGLFQDYKQIEKVPEGKKAAYRVGTQAEQAKLREIVNSSHILLQLMKRKYQKNRIYNLIQPKKIIGSIYHILQKKTDCNYNNSNLFNSCFNNYF